jgi:hypothetical protein
MLAGMTPAFRKIRHPLLFCLLLQTWPVMAQDKAQNLAACQRPQAPSISDGRSARKEQIAEMREAVVGFITDNVTYRDCLDRELKLLANLNSPQAQALKAYIDEAIADSLEMDDLVADTFNTQLRIYKSVNK